LKRFGLYFEEKVEILAGKANETEHIFSIRYYFDQIYKKVLDKLFGLQFGAD
jgi:hypothetical protein